MDGLRPARISPQQKPIRVAHMSKLMWAVFFERIHQNRYRRKDEIVKKTENLNTVSVKFVGFLGPFSHSILIQLYVMFSLIMIEFSAAKRHSMHL